MALLSLLGTDPSLLAVLFWGSLELALEQQLPIVEREEEEEREKERGDNVGLGVARRANKRAMGVFLGVEEKKLEKERDDRGWILGGNRRGMMGSNSYRFLSVPLFLCNFIC